MIQGDICWYKFKEPNKPRPVLILTRTDLIPLLNTVTVVEITTTLRNKESELWLDETDGLSQRSAVNFVNIQTIQRARLGQPIAHLPAERWDEVREAIDFVFKFARD